MKKRTSTYLLILLMMMLVSCATRSMNTAQNKDSTKVESKDGKEPYLSRLATGLLEYFGRKQRGEEDKHPVKTGLKPKIIQSN